MKKLLLTFGTGCHADCLDVTLPTFRAYADRHDYLLSHSRDSAELQRCAAQWPHPVQRPATWYKLPWIVSHLEAFDADVAVWIDADAVILDGSKDMLDEMPAHCLQGLVFYDHPRYGIVPGCGTWVVRRDMIPVLRRLWFETEYTHRPWHENSALIKRMGSNPDARPIRMEAVGNELLDRTHRLDLTWGAIDCVVAPHPAPRIWHCVDVPHAKRAEHLRERLLRR